MCGAFTDAPPTGQGVNDGQPTAAAVMGASFAHSWLEAAAFIGDLALNASTVSAKGQGDPAATVNEGVRH